MCKDCLKEVCPDRGETTLEGGSYFLNYKGCQACKASMEIANIDVVKEEDDDGVETITLTHVCKKCNHEIARHEYQFEVQDGYQEYSMTCDLCGTGSASVSVAPVDPRKSSKLY